MRVLLDTNILLRGAQPDHPHHAPVIRAIDILLNANRRLGVSSQSIYEFLAVATRRGSENGLGMSHAQADGELERLLRGIEVLYDSSAIAAELRRLVVAHRVTGKKVHDVRLVATLIVFGFTDLLAFNLDDFERFRPIVAVAPDKVDAIIAAF